MADGCIGLDVLTSYDVRPDAALYSLAVPIEFCCAQCCRVSEATLVAVRAEWLLCPGCYALLDTLPEPAPETLGVVAEPAPETAPEALEGVGEPVRDTHPTAA